jgi:RNA polymerase sigma-70 factor (ECF subfamily)
LSSEVYGEEELDELLMRLRAGDRAAAAEFISRFGPRIRRRIRGQLAPAMRRLFDSQDILSTLGRRLDAWIAGNQLQAVTASQLWALVFRIADNALIEKARVFRSLQAREGEDSPFAQGILRRLEQREKAEPDGALIEIDVAINALDDATDRDILALWLMGNQHKHIAESVGLPAPTVRKRWEKIRGQLRVLYEAGAV